MSYESTAEPIKLGYLMDFTLAARVSRGDAGRLHPALRHRLRRGARAGPDRSTGEIVLPRGRGPAQGFGQSGDRRLRGTGRRGLSRRLRPHITDNCVPTREAIEERFKVPAISVTGTDDWLGEWTFAFPQGSMTDEPIFLADLIAKRGLTEIGVLVEQILIGESYLKNLRSCLSAARAFASSPRRRSRRPPRTSTRQSARCTTPRPRRSCISASASGSSSSIRRSRQSAGTRRDSPDGLPERLGQPDHVERVHGLDRGRPVRREQPDRSTTSSTATRGDDGRRPSTACRWSIATLPPCCCAPSATRIR